MKRSADKKTQIIQTALQIFKEKGYEQTSVQNIIDALGLSKGGFYHYYHSKEALLEDIAQMFLKDILQLADQILASDELNAIEKLNGYIRKVNQMKKENLVQVTAFIHELYANDKNKRLEDLVFVQTKEKLTPFIQQIIVQGMAEKSMLTTYPEEAAQTFVKLLLIHQREMSGLLYEAIIENNDEKLALIQRKYAFFQQMAENMLGIKENSFEFKEVAKDTIEYIKINFYRM